MNPALPGTILTLAAAILLALATVTAPVTKTLYFLEVTPSSSVSTQTFKFGALGYCLGSTCTSPRVGYDISDAAALLGVSSSKVPYLSTIATNLVHGLTYVLILHPVACGLALLAFLLAVLQHCAIGMGCLATFVAGLGTTVSLASFAIDLALFTILKKRVEDEGGTASYGQSIWLTLAAAVLLIVAQIALCCSCCCPGSSVGRGGMRRKKNRDDYQTPHPDVTTYGQQMRMDALEAEQNRKATAGTGHLPKFAEFTPDHEVPLKNDYEYHGYEDNSRAYGHGQAGVGRSFGQGGYDANPFQQQGNGYAAHSGPGYVNGVGPTYGGGSASTVPGAAAAGLAASSAYLNAAPQDDTSRTLYTDDPYGRAHPEDYAQEYSGQTYGGEDAYPYHQPGPSQPTSGYATTQPGGQDHGFHADEATAYHYSQQQQQQQQQQQATAHRNLTSPESEGYSQYADPAATGPSRAHSVAPSVTSGYAVGGPTTMAMPVPLPAQGTRSVAQSLGMNSGGDPGYQSQLQQQQHQQQPRRQDSNVYASAYAHPYDSTGGSGAGGDMFGGGPSVFYDAHQHQHQPASGSTAIDATATRALAGGLNSTRDQGHTSSYQLGGTSEGGGGGGGGGVAGENEAENEYQNEQAEVPSYESAMAYGPGVGGEAEETSGVGGGMMGRRGPLPIPGVSSNSQSYPVEKTPAVR